MSDQYTITEWIDGFPRHMKRYNLHDKVEFIIGEHSPSGLWPRIIGMNDRFPNPGWGWVDYDDDYHDIVTPVCIKEINTDVDDKQLVINVWDWCQNNNPKSERLQKLAK